MILIGFLINDLTFLSYVTCWDETTIVMSLGHFYVLFFEAIDHAKCQLGHYPLSNRPPETVIGIILHGSFKLILIQCSP